MVDPFDESLILEYEAEKLSTEGLRECEIHYERMLKTYSGPPYYMDPSVLENTLAVVRQELVNRKELDA